MSLMKLWALESFMNGKKQEKSEKTIRPPVGSVAVQQSTIQY
jgi:hypothetical protein